MINKKEIIKRRQSSETMGTLRNINLRPMNIIKGYKVRPGFYETNGATAIPCGVNFTVFSHNATSIELALFRKGEAEPFVTLPFPEHYRIGNVYSMIVFDIDISSFEYAYRIDGPYDQKKGLVFNKEKYLLDPYAKAITGQSDWGKRMGEGDFYKARVVKDNFDWGEIRQPLIPMEDLIIYELHVRGFTKDGSSGIDEIKRGTFAGIIDKIPYLKELGINVVELMPVFEFDETINSRDVDGDKLYEYWGYNTVGFFAPNTSYSSKKEYNHEGTELKKMITALNENGIEVYLDVVFNHTAEGDENGPFFSFKGFDNNIYYLLTPEGYYYNFSGCGNSLNCNHPIVKQMIIDCLRYWVTAYHIDGFRFDLASILGRNQDGSPMSNPPLLQSLAFDPILGDAKLIAEAWDAGGLYQVGNFPSWNRWAEWNGKYRDDMRRFLKGDDGLALAAAYRISGSHDLYDPTSRKDASVNFITCHDGFTLNDLYSYNEKKNEKNAWNCTDGANDNYSWNCGAEGETTDEEVLKLRKRMMKNACAVLMCSRGIPMFLAGDEFGNTQYGNNNAYCQDNLTSWLDWTMLEKNKDIFEFFKKMINFRQSHRSIRTNMSGGTHGYPDTSFHGGEPWQREFSAHDHYVGVMFCGEEPNTRPDFVYIGVNTYWEDLNIALPQLPAGLSWHLAVDTYTDDIDEKCSVSSFKIKNRSVMVFIAK